MFFQKQCYNSGKVLHCFYEIIVMVLLLVYQCVVNASKL